MFGSDVFCEPDPTQWARLRGNKCRLNASLFTAAVTTACLQPPTRSQAFDAPCDVVTASFQSAAAPT